MGGVRTRVCCRFGAVTICCGTNNILESLPRSVVVTDTCKIDNVARMGVLQGASALAIIDQVDL